jgi:DnaK suppressor protein
LKEISMDSEDLREIRELLITQKEELLKSAADTLSELAEPAENYPDPTDRATFEANRSFNLRMRERELNLINKIDRALDRLNSGRFGICEVCGEEIGLPRLKARPVTTLCFDCKSAQEEREK